MDGVKSVLASKGVWGGALAVLGTVAGYLFHVTVTEIDVQQLGDNISAIVASVGGLIAIYGRIVATKTIGGK